MIIVSFIVSECEKKELAMGLNSFVDIFEIVKKEVLANNKNTLDCAVESLTYLWLARPNLLVESKEVFDFVAKKINSKTFTVKNKVRLLDIFDKFLKAASKHNRNKSID